MSQQELTAEAHADPTPAQDMQDNFRPDPAIVNAAVAALVATPNADYAAVGLVLPNKTSGWWTVGQQCLTVPGAIFLGHNKPTRDGGPVDGMPSYSWARNEAMDLAERLLGDRPGTVGYASIRRDGTWAVFEY
jgi:hypothetical protein